MHIVLKASGIEKTAKALGKDHERVIRQGFDHIGDAAVRLTIEEAPKKSRELISQIRLRRTRWTWNVVEGPTKHGLWVREGTIGHSIFPKKKKALWWTPGLPHPVGFAANPGIRNKNPYPQRAHSRLTNSISRTLPMIGQNIVLSIG